MPEYDAVEIERIFNDACRWNTYSQDVLQRRKIIRLRYRFNAVEVTARNNITILCLTLRHRVKSWGPD